MVVWGGPMGSPGVPDGRSMPPWHGRSGLRKNLGVIGDFRARRWVFNFNYKMTDVVKNLIFKHLWGGGGWRGPLVVLQMSPKLGFGLLLCIESISDGIFVHFCTLSSFLPYCSI